MPEFVQLNVPKAVAANHLRQGGRGLKRWVCIVPDGFVRVMAGFEPCADGGGMAWHVSVSVARNGEMISSPIRRPTDVEVSAACALVDAEFTWREYQSDTSLIRHFFSG